MPLNGTAFLPIWHDIDPHMDLEYNRWHTHEHIPERVYTPGITTGRRYEAISPSQRQKYFLLYEAQSFDVFESDGYFATANARSQWTQAIDPHFQNFSRAPCHLMITRGRGIAGLMATIRIKLLQPSDETPLSGQLSPRDAFSVAVRSLVEKFYSTELVIGAHAGMTAPISRQPLSKESLSLRPNASAFDAVIMIEAVHLSAMKASLPQIREALDGTNTSIDSYEIGVYTLAQYLQSY